MTAHARGKRWDQFYGFIEDAANDLPALKNELESVGLDVARVDLAVSGIVARGRSQARVGWLERARSAQSDFERAWKSKKSWMSEEYGNAREIVSAIASGKLGAGIQSQAGVFFRNRDLKTASEADLKSFLDDCELLGLLDKDQGEPR